MQKGGQRKINRIVLASQMEQTAEVSVCECLGACVLSVYVCVSV